MGRGVCDMKMYEYGLLCQSMASVFAFRHDVFDGM
jgi:hypothetical protein